MIIELARKMEFTRENMLPFLLSQLELLQHQEGRTISLSVDAQDLQNHERIWTNLRSNPSFQETSEPDILEVITQDGLVMHVNGVANVTRFCQTESPMSVPHTWKQRVTVSKNVLPNELSFKVYVVINEDKELQLEEEPSDWSDVPKYYILQKKFVYTMGNCRIIFNHVRTASDAFVNMYQADVARVPVEYELTLEIQNAKSEQDLMDALLLLAQVIENTPYPLAKSQQQEVSDGYQRLVNRVLERRGSGFHFLAPKPVTLERMNLADPLSGYGVVSILSGYTVTEKADGERYLLYVHTDGMAYLINNTMDVKHTGLRATSQKLRSTIIDGELVTFDKRRDDSKTDLFLAFDMYFLDGQSVMGLPLVHKEKPSRFGKMMDIFDEDLWVPVSRDDEPFVELRVKEHIHQEGSRMFDACRTILQNANGYPYEIDGLVFTPANLGVFAYYPGKPAKITDNVRWDRVFKWKPAEQNTIDFMIEKESTPYVDPLTKKKYGVFKLFTGYNANQWEAISVMNGLRMRYDRAYAEQLKETANVYKTRLFRPISQYEKGVEYAYVPYGELTLPVAMNGDIVEDKSIVEFSYEPRAKGHPSMRWKALRVREDKTRIFKRTGQLSKTANDLTVAMSIWRSIHAPVTSEMIMGLQPVNMSDIPEDLEDRLLGVDDTYYAREVPRAHMLSVHMLNFHNQGIKKMLYHKSSRRNALLELACGMAGDLPRWRDAAYKFILGVDLVRDNITHPREGSYARVVRQRRAVKTIENGVEKTIYPDTVFVIGDCALPLQDGTAAAELDEESKKVLQLVYRSNSVPQTPYLKYIVGRAARGFDVVSCQFAIHYFFQSPEKLHGFLSNVSRNLVKGGIFIATFMDGDRVHDLVASSPTGVVEGRKLDGTVPVWAIIKRYTTYTSADEEPFGKMVDVYLENTNRLISEFLVNLELLQKYASGYGLEIDETRLFSETFAELRQAVPENPSQQTELDKNILMMDEDEVQKQFSFLNRWIVFRKVN